MPISNSEIKYRELAETLPEGVFEVDLKGKVIYCNQKLFEMVGADPKNLAQGVNAMDIIVPQERERAMQNMMASMKGEKKGDHQYTAVRTDGSTFPIIIHSSPVLDAAGKPVGLRGLIIDISEFKRLEKYRSEFVANISHELKTPLTAIRGYVETLLDGALEDKEHNRLFLNKIKQQSQYLSSLIDDILELSRLEGRINITPFVKIDIRGVIRRVLATVSEKAAKKGINLDTSRCQGGDIAIQGNDEAVFRAVRNVVENAINYTDQNGKVEIYCTRQDGQVGIVVADTGIGIAPEHIPRIFERFYRVEKARSRELGGTGLGLSIAKHVMSIHHGQVLVESELRKGSKFTLLFPIIQSSEKTTQTSFQALTGNTKVLPGAARRSPGPAPG